MFLVPIAATLTALLAGAPAPAAPAAPPGMVLIPGGRFEMGSRAAELDDLAELGRAVPHMEGNCRHWFSKEVPLHPVTVAPFYLDRYEVTNADFGRFVEATGYQAEGDWRRYATPQRARHPVVNVTWNDARAYAAWRGARLPSEAEWEWAARGGCTGRSAGVHCWFPWGDEPDHYSRANYGHDRSFWAGLKRLFGLTRIRTRPVGSYAANGYGLYDTAGNAAEWCAGDLLPYPGCPPDAAPFDDEDYLSHPLKACRGGSWQSPNPVFIRANCRRGLPATTASWSVGFRCARSLGNAAERPAASPAVPPVAGP